MTIKSIGGASALFAALLSSALAAQTPATELSSAASVSSPAENIRNLNIMLMVTSLRCRGGAHDFSTEYDRFAATHGRNIADAQRQLVAGLSARYGRRGSARHLDRQSVQVANRFGQGHPSMNCAQLKEAATELSMSQDSARLTTMANRLLNPSAGSTETKIVQSQRASAIPYDSSVSVSEVPAWLRE